jgi:hypothetical protein
MLRVPDTAAGKQAKCPQCQSLVNIPADMAQPQQPEQPAPQDPSFPNAPTSPFGEQKPPADIPSDNPYATSAMPEGGYGSPTEVSSGPIRNVQVDAGDVFRHAFECWKRDLGVLVAGTLVVGILSNLPQIPFSVAEAILRGQGNEELAMAVSLSAIFVVVPIQFYLSFGILTMGLASARNERVEFGMIFYRGPNVLGKIVSVIAFYFLASISMLACCAGLLILLFYWPFTFIMIDKNTGFTESFSLAREVTRGNEVSTVVLLLMAIGVSILGILAFCIGLIFTQPLWMMLFATGYLMMSGQLKVGRAN